MPRNTTKPPLAIVDESTCSHGSPPRKLGQAGLNLWNSVQSDYGIEDCGGVEVLMQICCAGDRLEALVSLIARDGLMVRTPNGPRMHPALAAELATRAFIVRTLAKLGILTETVKLPGRPGSGGLGVLGLDDEDDE